MSGRQFTDRDIHMALDGEMPADEQGDFEAWLSVNPDKKALSTRIVEDRRRLREALEPVLREPVPEALRKLVEGDQPAPARRTGWWRLAAAAALLAVGGGSGYALGLSGWKPVGSDCAIIADRAIEAYVIYSAEKLHVVEVGAAQRDHLVGWLSKRVGTRLVAPDFSAAGYELVGGRLLPAASKPAAQFMYQDKSGARISLYVARDSGGADTGFRLKEEQGACAFYWLDGGYGYAVTGAAMSQEKLQALASAAYKQLLAAQKG